MLNLKPATLARLAPALALALLSCAAPKAIVVEEAPAAETQPVEDALASGPAIPNMPDDGIRLPDMLGLPDEGELRSAASSPDAGTSDSGAVIARPPSGAPEKP